MTMKKAMAVVLVMIFAAPLSLLLAQTEQEDEVGRLLREREEIIRKLSQPQSPVVRTTLSTKLERIDRRLKELSGSSPRLEPKQETTEPTKPMEPTEPTQDVPLVPDLYDKPEADIRTPPSMAGRYRFEFGVLPRYNSNFFQSTGGAPSTAVFVTTLTGKFGVDLLRREVSSLAGTFRIQRNIHDGVDNADSYVFDATLGYRFSRNRLYLTYFTIPRRLAFITTDQDVFSRLDGINLGYSRRVTRRTRVRISYQAARQIFSDFKERDAARHRLRGELRYRIHPLFMPGIGYEWSRDNAQSDNFTYNRWAPLLRLDSRIKRIVWVALRYRYQNRDYITVDPTGPNFGREDRRHEFRLYSNVKLTKHWWLYFYGSYLDNNSTRDTRAFGGHELGVGLMFRVPGK